MSEDYYIAELFAEHLPSSATIAAVRDALYLLDRTKQQIRPEELSTVLGDRITEEHSQSVVFALQNTGILGREPSDLDRDRLERVTRCAEVLADRDRPPENELVATIPDGEESIDERHFSPLLLRLRELVEEAEEDIYLVTPFFSSTIADRLVNPLDAAAQRGVDITITTRYLTYGNRDYNREYIRELLTHGAIRERAQLYEYVRDEDDLGGTVHAKMLVSDSTACYLGTANFTHRGLRDNLELGMILRDDSVTKLRDLVDSLRRSSLMHSVNYSEGTFTQIE